MIIIYPKAMKYWLSHLPLEVWVDVYRYPWISREELGRVAHRFRNRKYGQYLKFYLHDWGKRKLNELYINKQGLYNYVGREAHYLYFPQTEMPANIKSFEHIRIHHFDQRTIDFLRRIQPLFEADINFYVFGNKDPDVENLPIIFANLLPLLGPIHSLYLEVHALPMVRQCFGEKLAKINVLTIFDGTTAGMDAAKQAKVDFLLHWLTTPQQEDIVGTRFCEVWLCNDTRSGEHISTAICQEFLAAKHPCTFALYIHIYTSPRLFAEYHLQNSIGEELHCVQIQEKPSLIQLQITRHQVNWGTKLQEWIKENFCSICLKRSQTLVLCYIQPIFRCAVDARTNTQKEKWKRNRSNHFLSELGFSLFTFISQKGNEPLVVENVQQQEACSVLAFGKQMSIYNCIRWPTMA